MLGPAAQRLVQAFFALLGLVVLVFFLARLTGNPADIYLPLNVSEETRHQFIVQHGLDKPLIVQFGTYLEQLSHFDFGNSIRQSRPALDIVLEALPTSLTLAGLTMGLSILFAILTGGIASLRPGGIFDRVASLIALVGSSLPSFWVALVAVLLFAVEWRLLPTSGVGTPLHWIMPVGVMMLRPLGVIVQVVRGAMATALTSGYIKTARAKGASRMRVIFVHTLRNAMLPVITVIGDQAAVLINGAVVVETIYGLPGVGKILLDSIAFRDFAVIQTTVIATALLIFLLNIVIDVGYVALDPRVRYA
jgi:peptide/nickel transport system permease protein